MYATYITTELFYIYIYTYAYMVYMVQVQIYTQNISKNTCVYVCVCVHCYEFRRSSAEQKQTTVIQAGRKPDVRTW